MLCMMVVKYETSLHSSKPISMVTVCVKATLLGSKIVSNPGVLGGSISRNCQ